MTSLKEYKKKKNKRKNGKDKNSSKSKDKTTETSKTTNETKQKNNKDKEQDKDEREITKAEKKIADKYSLFPVDSLSKEEQKEKKEDVLKAIKDLDSETEYNLRYSYKNLYKELKSLITQNLEKTRKKHEKRDEKGRFKKGYTANPDGRPKGSRNFSTLWKKAVKNIAESQKEELDPEQVELILIKKAYQKASDGHFKFYKDIMDRVFGKAMQKTDITTGGKPINNKQIEDEVEKKLDTIFGDGEEEDSSDT